MGRGTGTNNTTNPYIYGIEYIESKYGIVAHTRVRIYRENLFILFPCSICMEIKDA